ncbi:cob(I)yrinic acid a,c-diamide adenosyltransferase [Chloroflexota bacterium]
MSRKSLDQGLVEVFTGDGKGKTSAALGVALRALGHNLKVYIVYFMKGGYPYGEQQLLTQLPNISFSIFGSKHFVDPTSVKPEEREEARKALEKAREVVSSGSYDVVILDEVNVAVAWKLIEVGGVLELIKAKPRNVEVILTGRHAAQRVIDAADLVTDMRKVKHPYDKGIRARKGIDC